MISYSGKDYRRAEAMFRRILDRDPKLLRVRLELARTLYMEKKDEQADYQFSLAAAEQTSSQVRRNIANFRQAIRARRSWRLNVDFGFAPDSNINSATEKESVNIYGLPFRLDPDARARSGTGRFVGGDASIRLSRFGQVPIYIGAYGRWIRYKDHRFDDAYAGLEAGPEFAVAGGRLRTTATVLKRWYGGHSLVSSLGARADYEKIVGGGWNIGGTLIVRHNDYAQRGDVDGWSLEARASASRPLGLTTLGFADATIERGTAADRGRPTGAAGSDSGQSRKSAGACARKSASIWPARSTTVRWRRSPSGGRTCFLKAPSASTSATGTWKASLPQSA
ncbi:DUF560 domain-containing protein [Sphingomonas sediminicola]|uniref:DUF560 domain-containing protein n=1 Tax=Sphingomonas sediminicola TaxID=386874 RepID=A0ABX6T8N1_9SPHN|nr:porin family protein [Sphingomonas sediminicola]QNP45766.1 DUF560 domain-containing protein [Sphingomonas sediminicola]